MCLKCNKNSDLIVGLSFALNLNRWPCCQHYHSQKHKMERWKGGLIYFNNTVLQSKVFQTEISYKTQENMKTPVIYLKGIVKDAWTIFIVGPLSCSASYCNMLRAFWSQEPMAYSVRINLTFIADTIFFYTTDTHLCWVITERNKDEILFLSHRAYRAQITYFSSHRGQCLQQI